MNHKLLIAVACLLIGIGLGGLLHVVFDLQPDMPTDGWEELRTPTPCEAWMRRLRISPDLVGAICGTPTPKPTEEGRS